MFKLKQYASIPNGLITSDAIYSAFRNYGLEQQNINKIIDENDMRQIYDILMSKSSERKLSFDYGPLDEGWKFFRTNMNNGVINNFEWKVYIPLKNEHYGFAVKNIIAFLSDNDIVSECKVSGTLRSDSMVINLTNEDDVTLLNEYIDRTISIKNCLSKHQPFIPDFNGIGVLHGYDMESSYTKRLSECLTKFVNYCKQQNRFDWISTEGFYISLQNSLNNGLAQNSKDIKQILEHLDVILNGKNYIQNTKQIHSTHL